MKRTHTPESSPTLRKARQAGKQILDLRDDGKWHDVSRSEAGKGSRRRSPDRHLDEEELQRRWNQTFGCQATDEQEAPTVSALKLVK